MRKSKNRKLAKAKADRYFSKYIRLRDTDHRGLGQCITCGKWLHWKQADCGHFALRDKEATRYDEQNCHLQCRHCNNFRSGKQHEHGVKIDEKYGEGTAEKLMMKSKMKSFRKQFDYECIAKKYKKLVDEILNNQTITQ